MSWVHFLIVANLCAIAVLLSCFRGTFDVVPGFLGRPWNKDESDSALQWSDCRSTFQCAHVTVPLNYSNPEDGTATIALIRIPSSFLPGDSEYRGPLLVNPGGPGISGVDFVIDNGGRLRDILGPEFDIVGFDPRGVGLSVPSVSFFNSPVERAFWPNLRDQAVTNETLPAFWARAKLQGKLAKERDNGVLRHINTEQTARDMLSIVEAHGRDKLQYWGFSYGSVLGTVFASLFPDRVDRLVIDGVVDAENYFSTLWSTNLLDTDKTIQRFFTTCVEAGPSSCPFYEPTPEAIADKLTSLFDTIRSQPMEIVTSKSYGILDYPLLRQTVFHSLFSPYDLFVPLSQGLADLARGNGTKLYEIFERKSFDCSCDDILRQLIGNLGEAAMAIHCNDGDVVPDSLDEAKSFLYDLMKGSQWAEVWAGARLSCIGWPQSSQSRFKGIVHIIAHSRHDPPDAFYLLKDHSVRGVQVTPSSLWATLQIPPLLSGSESLTSLAQDMKGLNLIIPHSAFKMSEKFPGSAVLTVDCPGHCSYRCPSSCARDYLRAYFVNGTMPETGVVCPVDRSPFTKAALVTNELKTDSTQVPMGS